MSQAKNEIIWTDPSVRSARLAIGREHSREADLERLIELAEPNKSERALDYVTGLGYVARAFASHVKDVDAFDPDKDVLKESSELAGQEGIDNIHFEVAEPMGIPYKNNTYDIVTARLALRHTRNPGGCLDEISRVLKKSGRLLIADSLAPPHTELVSFLGDLMRQRDSSHVGSCSLAEWETLLESRDFLIDQVEIYPKEHDFEEWAGELGADSDSVRMLAMMLQNASTRAKRHFRIFESAGKPVSFITWMILIRARPVSAVMS